MKAHEERHMLINESKSESKSRGIITQADHMERRKHKTLYIREAGKKGRAKMGAVRPTREVRPHCHEHQRERSSRKEASDSGCKRDSVRMLVINRGSLLNFDRQ